MGVSYRVVLQIGPVQCIQKFISFSSFRYYYPTRLCYDFHVAFNLTFWDYMLVLIAYIKKETSSLS